MKKVLTFLGVCALISSILFGQEVIASGNYTRIYAYTNGLSSEIPAGFKVDETLGNIATKLEGQDGTKIHIYNQPVNRKGAQTYIQYSNKQIVLGKGGVTFLGKDTVKYKNGAKAYRYYYKRPLLKTIENDKNYYYEVNAVYPKENRVVTFWLKSNEKSIEYYKGVLNHMAETTWLMQESNNAYFPPYKERNVSIKGEKISINIPENKMLWGIFHPHSLDKGNYIEGVQDIEKKLDWKFEFLMTYSDFQNNIPVEGVKKAYRDGRVMMLTMQPWFYGDRDSNIMIPQIVNGDYDNYIKKWAKDVKDIKEPIFIRFANEMNGDWDPWCAWFFAKDEELYIQAWKRVHTIFKEEGATNALFVFNPHDRSYPDFKWNNAHLYYPGDEYVDWVGLTGYNNGTSFKGDVWREFDQIYYNNYNEYMKYYSSKPFMITEFSCNETGGNKERWIREGFKCFNNMPNIKMAVWFDQVDMLWQYNIDSSTESFNAFKEALRYPRFSTDSVSISQEMKK